MHLTMFQLISKRTIIFCINNVRSTQGQVGSKLFPRRSQPSGNDLRSRAA